MFYYNIAFDFENNNEFLCYYTIENRNNSIYSFTRATTKQKLGTFLIEFLNTDFRKRKNFDSFVTKYSFIDLYAKLLFKEFNEKDIFSFKFTNEELQNLLDKMYKKCSEDFIEFGEIFRDIANTKSRYKLLSNLLKTESPKKSEIFDIKAYNISTKDYWQQLEEFSDLFDDICVDFQMLDFIEIYEKNNITNEIPYSFRSKDFLNIIYLSFKHIECYKHPILQCENCKKLFIPDSAHDIKYCNNIFKNSKTCKQLAPELKYQKTLKADPVLQKYRSRYQAIQRLSRENPEKHQALYEYYKVEGKKMKSEYLSKVITAKKFENWIDSTKLKKKEV